MECGPVGSFAISENPSAKPADAPQWAGSRGKHPDRYIVFTNVDLSHKDKGAIKRAVADGYARAKKTHVEIVGAGELVAAVNGLPQVRAAYFATDTFSTWQEAKQRHTEARVFGGAVKLVGREDELTALRELVDAPDARVI